jgi:hypothetical protein
MIRLSEPKQSILTSECIPEYIQSGNGKAISGVSCAAAWLLHFRKDFAHAPPSPEEFCGGKQMTWDGTPQHATYEWHPFGIHER